MNEQNLLLPQLPVLLDIRPAPQIMNSKGSAESGYRAPLIVAMILTACATPRPWYENYPSIAAVRCWSVAQCDAYWERAQAWIAADPGAVAISPTAVATETLVVWRDREAVAVMGGRGQEFKRYVLGR